MDFGWHWTGRGLSTMRSITPADLNRVNLVPSSQEGTPKNK
jgi:hypothetical protein